MPAVGGGAAPTLSKIRNWDVTHLENAAEYWRSLADQCDHAFNSAYQGSLSPGGTVWEGPAAQAAEARSLADMRVVSGLSDALRAAAQVADNGAGDLRNAQQGILLEVKEAEAAGLTVSESFSIGESNPFSTEARLPGRGELRQQFANEIDIRVAALGALDREIADSINAAIRPLSHLTFAEGPDLDRSPTDPPPLPPPLPPRPNEDPWEHSGDRSLTSIATAPAKKAVLEIAMAYMADHDQITAAALLDYYLANSGKPLVLPPALVDRWLADPVNGYRDLSLSPEAQISKNVRTVAQDAATEARRVGKAVTVSGNTPWEVVAGSGGDQVRSLGHYSLSTAYSLTVDPDGNYTVTYRNDISDWYNFSTSSMPTDVAHNVSNAAHDLQAVGWAQDFQITGSSSVSSLRGQVPLP